MSQRQKIEYEIEWPDEPEFAWFVAPVSRRHGPNAGFRFRKPPSGDCHVIIERPREVCGKKWWLGFDGRVRAPEGVPSHCIEIRCTLDAGHGGPCMMELGSPE